MNPVFYTGISKRAHRTRNGAAWRYRGYYQLEKGGVRKFVELGTPDKNVALKRIHEIALQAQREQEGIIAPKIMREAQSKSLGELVGEYEKDLNAMKRARKHVHDSVHRIRRIVGESGWKTVRDITPDSFVAWRVTLQTSPKTVKEYQISLNAFLNWLCRIGRMAENPLRYVPSVETRGREVRPYRAFTEAELAKLFAVAGRRRLAYQVLLYTGQRKSEVRELVWGDLHLDLDQPYALFREGTTKDKDKRAVPLRSEIAALLREARKPEFDLTRKVFWFCWPTYDLLRSDLKKAGIEREDAMGRVVHFHSFRKTWQTWGARYGINQRAAQEILGHSDANLTAKVYTDVPALGIHDEMAKLPWIDAADSLTQPMAQKSGVPSPSVSLADICAQFIKAVQVRDVEEISHALSSAVTSCPTHEKAARAGIEPVTTLLEVLLNSISCGNKDHAMAQRKTHTQEEIAVLIRNWTKLSPKLRCSILGLVQRLGAP